MQHTQVNYRSVAYGALVAVALILATKTAFSDGIAARGRPEPILTNSPPKNSQGACDPQLGQADLVGGTDVDGNPVTPADLPGAPAPFKGQVEVPLKAQAGQAPAYVTVDGGKLDPLLNPKPCK